MIQRRSTAKKGKVIVHLSKFKKFDPRDFDYSRWRGPYTSPTRTAETGTSRRGILTAQQNSFIQNLPDSVTKQALEGLFSQYVALIYIIPSFGRLTLHYRHPNFVEVRLIPSRKGIAFVQYEDETSSSSG